MNFRRWFVLLPLLAAWFVPAQAQTSFAPSFGGEKKLVIPSLVADAAKIAPSRPFTVGVRLKLAPGWHTYWRYPGEAGGAPKIDWTLPEGFHAGEIQWPTPHSRIDEGDLLTYVYEGDLMLPVEITPPASLPAGNVTLKAHVRWLVCEKTCIPGEGDVELQVATGDQSEPANVELFAKVQAQLPKQSAPPFAVKWEVKADALTLHLTGLPHDTKAEFFPLPPKGVSLEHPKISEVAPDGSRTITLPITEGGTATQTWNGLIATTKSDGSVESWSVSSANASQSIAQAPSTISPNSGGNAGSFLLKLFVAFFGGLIMNVMPCVLPVIALKIFGFVGQGRQEPGRVFRLGLAFNAGVFAFFLGLATAVARLKLAFNWGYQFQNTYLLAGIIALVFVFALSLLGVFEVSLSSGVTTKLSELSGREGYGGAFLHGLFTTLLGTSCTAPFLSTSLGFAVTQPTPLIFLLFTAVAAGMSLPYFLLTAKPAWLRYVPKPGPWMERLKQLMGFAMLAVAVWLLGVLGIAHGAELGGAMAWFLFAVGLASWIFGTFRESAIGRVAALVIVGGGYLLFLNGKLGAMPTKTASTLAPEAGGIAWQPYSEETLAAALKAGQPVFVDFTADWCVNCKVYERLAIETEPARAKFRDKKVVALKADWTSADPVVSRALKSFGRVGVPIYVLYRPGEEQPVVLDALTQGVLLGELDKIKN